MKKFIYALLCTSLSLNSFAQIITTIAGNGTVGTGGDGGAATAAQISYPSGVAFDALGNMYITEETHYIRKVDMNGITSTIAGNGTGSVTGNGGPAVNATVNDVESIVADAAGNVYFTDDFGHTVRKIDLSGNINVFAGTGTTGGYTEGAAAATSNLTSPRGLAIDDTGNIYIADEDLDKVVKVNTSGIISTFVSMNGALSVAADHNGNIYVGQDFTHYVYKVTSAGVITAFAGTGASGYTGDGGLATAAQIGTPVGLAVDDSNNVYFTDYNFHCIRKINTSGIISTIAGTGTGGYNGDGILADTAQLNAPWGITVNNSGHVVVCDEFNSRVRLIGPAYNSTPIFVSGDGTVQNITVCSGTTDTINSLLAVLDSDAGQTETWSVLVAPQHGTLNAGYTTLSNADTLTPTGLTYTPTAAYGGIDTFSVVVTDGTAYDTTTIIVTITPLFSAGNISGPASVCIDSTITLSTTGSWGGWLATNTNASINVLSGVVSGITVGTDTIAYITGNMCGVDTATYIVAITNDCALGVTNISANNASFSVYPNPSAGAFTLLVTAAYDEATTITITNAAGEKIREITGTTNHAISVSDNSIAAGVYFISANTAHSRLQKIMTITR